jgi:hypothetical protein
MNDGIDTYYYIDGIDYLNGKNMCLKFWFDLMDEVLKCWEIVDNF